MHCTGHSISFYFHFFTEASVSGNTFLCAVLTLLCFSSFLIINIASTSSKFLFFRSVDLSVH